MSFNNDCKQEEHEKTSNNLPEAKLIQQINISSLKAANTKTESQKQTSPKQDMIKHLQSIISIQQQAISQLKLDKTNAQTKIIKYEHKIELLENDLRRATTQSIAQETAISELTHDHQITKTENFKLVEKLQTFKKQVTQIQQQQYINDNVHNDNHSLTYSNSNYNVNNSIDTANIEFKTENDDSNNREHSTNKSSPRFNHEPYHAPKQKWNDDRNAFETKGYANDNQWNKSMQVYDTMIIFQDWVEDEISEHMGHQNFEEYKSWYDRLVKFLQQNKTYTWKELRAEMMPLLEYYVVKTYPSCEMLASEITTERPYNKVSLWIQNQYTGVTSKDAVALLWLMYDKYVY